MGNVESVIYRNYDFDEMKKKHLEKIQKNTNTNKQINNCFSNNSINSKNSKNYYRLSRTCVE